MDTESFTNFPVLILLSGSDYSSSINDAAISDGSDIAFTDSNGTDVLPFELVTYDESNDILQAWVQIPSLSEASDKAIYLYYGNPTPSLTPDNPWNTSDNGFEAVWHFDDDVVSTNIGVNSSDEGSALDVTGDASGNDVVSATGQIGNAFSFPGTDNTDDWFSVDPGGTALDISGSAITVSAWINPNDQGQSDDNNSQFSVLEKSDGTGGNDGKYWLGIEENNGDELYLEVRVAAGGGNTIIDDDGGTDMLLSGDNNGWYFISMVYDGSNLQGFLNAVSTLSQGETGNIGVEANDILRIGARQDDRRYNGLIDEVRVASTARSQAWLLTEFNNQVNPSTSPITPNAVTFEPFIALTATESALDISFTSSANFLISPNNTVTFTVSGSDFDGNTSYDLQSSSDNSSFTDVPGFTNLTASDFTSPTIGTDTYYRINAINVGAGNESFTSSSILIDVEPAFVFSSYTHRRSITIDETQVFGEDNTPSETNHTNFPILVSFTSEDLKSKSNGGDVGSELGYDIIFTDSDASTQLDHDLESYNPVTGEVIAWVEIPSLDTQNDDEIFIYYGNGSITASQSTVNTWSNDYEGVWHMNQDPVVTRVFDFSGNGNDAVPVALESDDLVTGKIGNGIDLDGYDADGGGLGEFLFVGAEDLVPSTLNITGQNLTVSGWINPTVTDNDQYSIIEKGNNNQDVDIAYWLGRDDNDGQARLGTPETGGNGLRLNSSALLTNGSWAYLTMTYDGSDFILYVNGQVGDSDARTGNIISDAQDEFFMGGRDDNTDRFFDGIIDELRVATAARSAGWVQTEYQNQCFASQFIDLQDERSCPDPVVGGTATATDAAIFIGETTSVVLSGYTTTADIQWEVSTDEINFADISGETSSQIDVGPLSVTTTYRARISNSNCTAYSTLATVQATEPILAGYSFRKCIEINPAQVIDDDADEVLLNFPILIDIRNDPDLNSDNVDRNGEFAANNEPFPLDIVFSDVTGSLLTFEMEEFAFNGVSPNETGSVRAWVLIPSLSTVSSTKIFMNYGNCNVESGATSSVTDNGNSVTNSTNTNTWVNNFVGVWHLEDETSIGDATSNNLDGTIQAGPLVNATGQIGDGVDLPGAGSSEYILIDDGGNAPAVVESFSSYTLSAWVNTGANNGDRSIIELSDGTTTDNGDIKYFLGLDDGDVQVRASVGSGSADQSIDDNVSIPLQDVNDGSWHYINAVYDGTEITTYVDGNFAGTSDNTNLNGNINSEANDELRLGARNDTRRFDGSVDELRIANAARAAGWIQTEYNNQVNPIIDIATPANNGNFYTLSDEESFVLWTDDGANSNWDNTDNWGICREPASDETVRIADPTVIAGSNPTFNVSNDEIGGILIETGGDLTFGSPSNTLTINGDVTNNSGGTFTPPGTITLGGTSKQSIQGNDPSTFGTLVIDNPSGIDIDAFTTISNSLTFTNGFITLTDDTLAIASSASIVNASSTSFIVTPFDNCLFQNVSSGAGNVLFPIGVSNTSYTPATINNTGTADNFCIYVAENVYSEGFIGAGIQQSSRAVDRTWFIAEEVDGGSNVTLTLQWNGTEELTSFDRTNMFISHYVSPNWVRYGSNIVADDSNAPAYTGTVSGVTAFSPISAGSGTSVLPVELIKFGGYLKQESIMLEWTTASETNNEYFLIEKSRDSKEFRTLSRIPGAGTTTSQTDYVYADKDPFYGINYYRLTQLDFDGSTSHSEIVAIDFRDLVIPDINAYPNPNSGSFNLMLTGFRGRQNVQLEVYTIEGHNILTQDTITNDQGESLINVNLNAIKRKLLIMKVSSGGISLSRRIVIE